MNASILLNALTRADRNLLINKIGEAVSKVDGWIEDVHFFSNISVALQFVIPAQSRMSFANLLQAQPMIFDADDLSKFTDLPETGANEEVTCTLQITFFHDDPDLRRHIPGVPG